MKQLRLGQRGRAPLNWDVERRAGVGALIEHYFYTGDARFGG